MSVHAQPEIDPVAVIPFEVEIVPPLDHTTGTADVAESSVAPSERTSDRLNATIVSADRVAPHVSGGGGNDLDTRSCPSVADPDFAPPSASWGSSTIDQYSHVGLSFRVGESSVVVPPA